MTENQDRYAGFWIRFCAGFIDWIFCLPFVGIEILLSNQTRYAEAINFFPMLIFTIWYEILLVKKYGGTPGKLIMKIKIQMVDGSPLTFSAALKRYSVNLLLGYLSSLLHIWTIFNMKNYDLSMTYKARMHEIEMQMPAWGGYLGILMMAWSFSEFLTMLFDDRRRSLHDFIAGTVVIKQPSSLKLDIKHLLR
ncbi:MAG: RDD family protein [Bdellovibrio sp.]